jgi:hypothetical protein
MYHHHHNHHNEHKQGLGLKTCSFKAQRVLGFNEMQLQIIYACRQSELFCSNILIT